MGLRTTSFCVCTCVYVCFPVCLAGKSRAKKKKQSWYWKHLDFLYVFSISGEFALFVLLANKFNTFFTKIYRSRKYILKVKYSYFSSVLGY